MSRHPGRCLSRRRLRPGSPDGGRIQGGALHRRCDRDYRRQSHVYEGRGLVAAVQLAGAQNYPDEAKEDAGKGLYYWALARESYIGFTYNKNLLPKAAVPKNFDGLLQPELKGKMGISISSTTGSKSIGAMVKAKGEEFVKKLKEQQIKLYSIDTPALVNVIASGEIVASPAIFESHTILAASKGAPLEWVPMDLVPNNVGSAAIALKPPHPHAAVLMADMLLGPDGQKVLEKFYYGSATNNGRSSAGARSAD
jgi:ABC-type Fe3+ transport system substrate-binding protein